MNKKLKILFTGRDPVAAYILQNIYNNSKNKKFKIYFLVQNPAYKILHKYLKNKIIYFRNTKNKKILLDLSKYYIEKYKPNLIISNSSGPDYGLDEAIINIGNKKNIMTFCIQSYWGDINKIFNSEPDIYFVIDKFAKKITKMKTNKKINVIGSIRHENYSLLKLKKNSIIFKRKYNLNSNNKIFTFFGQPTEFIEDYLESIQIFYNYINSNIKGVVLLYKIHPKENIYQINQVIKYFINNKINYKIIKHEEIEKIFIHSLCSISIFSSTGYDCYQLKKYSSYFGALPIYLFFNKKLRNDFIKFTGLKTIPLSSINEALVVNSSSDFKKISNLKKINSLREKSWKSARKNVNFKLPSSSLLDMLII
tara:strand:+ start:195 stop:1292 length:1098 start_codon:yes stop_codon:yes gene_type:complete